jgi:hypothetical protein
MIFQSGTVLIAKIVHAAYRNFQRFRMTFLSHARSEFVSLHNAADAGNGIV